MWKKGKELSMSDAGVPVTNWMPCDLILTCLKLKGIKCSVTVKKTNPNFLNGIPELVVLRLLSEREMYGYELVKAIQERTKDALTFGEGCIYPILHYLEQTRFVSSRRQEAGGRSRNYYRLTPRGRKRLEALSMEWQQVTAGVSLVLEGQHA